jgi:hypothetical protein
MKTPAMQVAGGSAEAAMTPARQGTAVDVLADVACVLDVDAMPWDLEDAFRRLDGLCSHAIGFALVCHLLGAARRADGERRRHVLAAIACSRAGVPFP